MFPEGYIMNAYEIIIGAILIVVALVVIAIILLQEGRQSNLGAISGGAESFMDKGRARTLDAFLARWTKIIAVVFFVLVLAGMLITKFLGA
jgi:preprotein translocase subunit SecG